MVASSQLESPSPHNCSFSILTEKQIWEDEKLERVPPHTRADRSSLTFLQIYTSTKPLQIASLRKTTASENFDAYHSGSTQISTSEGYRTCEWHRHPSARPLCLAKSWLAEQATSRVLASNSKNDLNSMCWGIPRRILHNTSPQILRYSFLKPVPNRPVDLQ